MPASNQAGFGIYRDGSQLSEHLWISDRFILAPKVKAIFDQYIQYCHSKKRHLFCSSVHLYLPQKDTSLVPLFTLFTMWDTTDFSTILFKRNFEVWHWQPVIHIIGFTCKSLDFCKNWDRFFTVPWQSAFQKREISSSFLLTFTWTGMPRPGKFVRWINQTKWLVGGFKNIAMFCTGG